jgi:hypothetical protein
VLPLQVKADGADPMMAARRIVREHRPSLPEPVTLRQQAVVERLPKRVTTFD